MNLVACIHVIGKRALVSRFKSISDTHKTSKVKGDGIGGGGTLINLHIPCYQAFWAQKFPTLERVLSRHGVE